MMKSPANTGATKLLYLTISKLRAKSVVSEKCRHGVNE